MDLHEPGTRCGRCRRSGQAACPTRDRSTARSTRSAGRATAVEHGDARLRDLLAGDRQRRHDLHRIVRLQALRARPPNRRAEVDVRHQRPHLRLARARPGRPAARTERDLRRFDRRLGVRARPRPGSCCWSYDTGEADPLLAGARPGPGRARRDPVRRLLRRHRSTRWTPPPGGDAGPSTPSRAIRSCATATSSTARRRSGAPASTSAARTATSGTSRTTTACTAPTGAVTTTPERPTRRTSLACSRSPPGGTTERPMAARGRCPRSAEITGRLIVRHGRQDHVRRDACRPRRPRARPHQPARSASTPQLSGDGRYVFITPTLVPRARHHATRHGVAGPGAPTDVRVANWTQPDTLDAVRRVRRRVQLPDRALTAVRSRCVSRRAGQRVRAPAPRGAAARVPSVGQPDRLRQLRAAGRERSRSVLPTRSGQGSDPAVGDAGAPRAPRPLPRRSTRDARVPAGGHLPGQHAAAVGQERACSRSASAQVPLQRLRHALPARRLDARAARRQPVRRGAVRADPQLRRRQRT